MKRAPWGMKPICRKQHRVGKKQELMVPLEYLDPAII
jgi:hypothetical protein